MDENLQKTAEIIEQTDVSEMRGKYLTFWTDNQLFGVPIAHVVQIVGMQAITPVPEFPHYARGIINLRGSIIPLIDVRLRLNKAESEYNERTCIIVTSISGHDVGVIVDEVDAVASIADDRIAPPPTLSNSYDGYITGVGKLEDRMVLLMDICKIIGVEDLECLTNTAIE